MTVSSPLEWLSAVAAAAVGARAARRPLATELDGYQCLLAAWEEALAAAAADPADRALAVLARQVDRRRLQELRALFCPHGLCEALALLPVPGLEQLPEPEPLGPWAAPGLSLWQATVAYRRRLDRWLALYEGLGTRALRRLESTLAAGAARPVRSPAALYGLWQHHLDACEAAVVQAPEHAPRLAAVVAAGARLRAEQHQWAAQWLGVDGGRDAQRALSDEIAAIRRQLRQLMRAGR